MKRTSLRILSVIAAGALGACSDSTGVDTELTEAEAAELAGAVMQSIVFTTASGPGGQAQASGPLAAPYSSQGDVSFTAQCDLGGTVDVDGEVEASGDDETGEGRIELTVTHDHEGCVVESENGVLFTFDGSPRLSLDLVIESDGEGELGWSGTIDGGVDWTTDELEGHCSIDLTFSGLVSDAEDAIAVSVEGAVCRRAVEVSWSLDVGLDEA